MGVPAFYRWLSVRYPKTVGDCIEEEAERVGALEIPVDLRQPNPNGVEFDNLYLDMNGIIHPCFHPEDRPAPTTESEVFLNIFDYIDRLVGIARPRKLIYMAIDGVAPRAKMNQQRSRRFRAAQDREDQKKEEEKLRAEFLKQGIKIPRRDEGETFDSNTITPGTPFMDRLAMALQWYVHKRLNETPGWRDLVVVLSDSNTPGEGEHKFMQFVREQRDRPGWNPNTWHCVYGLDADLIMLALASHEPHFYLLREVVFTPQDQHKKRQADFYGNAMLPAQGKSVAEAPADVAKPDIAKKPFQFLKINVLRDYLALEYSDLALPFAYDPERVIDDFVFLCFFVGNDFLPHMPTLDIREGGIELMLHVYRRELPNLNGYLSNGSYLYLDRVERFISSVGKFEDEIFQSRARKMQADKRRFLSRKAAADPGRQTRGSGTPQPPPQANPNFVNPRAALAMPIKLGEKNFAPTPPTRPSPAILSIGADGSNKGAAEMLRQRLKRKAAADAGAAAGGGGAPAAATAPAGAGAAGDHVGVGVLAPPADNAEGEVAKKAKLDSNAAAAALWSALAGGSDDTPAEAEESDTAIDCKQNGDEFKGKLKELMKEKTDMFEDMCKHEESIRLGEEGWRERYYADKFGVASGPEQEALVAEVVQRYVEGLCWVMRYYYDGVASWRWYYPFHYAPFASDLKNIASLEINFMLGIPFEPFNQLMGVLPAASSHALPKALQPLFVDENSPILDFYPSTFVVDMNGKRFAWQGVALLPFIDEARLLGATGPVIAKLPPDERRRNERRSAILLSRADSPAGAQALRQAQAVRVAGVPEAEYASHEEALDAASTAGISGQILPVLGDACPPVFPVPPFRNIGEDVPHNTVVMAMYKDPPHQTHRPRLLEGTVVIDTGLNELDRPKEEPLWCQRHGLRMAQRDQGWGDQGGRGGGRGGRGSGGWNGGGYDERSGRNGGYEGGVAQSAWAQQGIG